MSLYPGEADFIMGTTNLYFGVVFGCWEFVVKVWAERCSARVSCTALLEKSLSQMYRSCDIRWGINKEHPEYLGCSGIPETLGLLPRKSVITEVGPSTTDYTLMKPILEGGDLGWHQPDSLSGQDTIWELGLQTLEDNVSCWHVMAVQLILWETV